MSTSSTPLWEDTTWTVLEALECQFIRDDDSETNGQNSSVEQGRVFARAIPQSFFYELYNRQERRLEVLRDTYSDGSMKVVPYPMRPAHLEDIDAAIEVSRYMLGWEDNFDGEGSPAYTEETWRRATELLKTNAKNVWERDLDRVLTPKIVTGADGSIDIRWRLPNRQLVINVPSNMEEAATFYGKDDRGNPINGALKKDSDFDLILMWIGR